jgi:spore coat protein I
MPVIFRHLIDELKRFRKVARKGKSRFDYLFLKEVDYYIEEGEETLAELNNSTYMNLVTRAALDNTICHHDFTQHNILLSQNQEYITGFDNCCIEVKEYDIANFLRRKMRKCEWDIPTAKCMMDSYRSVCKIKDDEFKVLQIIINFPQKFWRIANKFYNSKRSWCEKGCLDKMDEVINEAAPLKNFIDNFDLIF